MVGVAAAAVSCCPAEGWDALPVCLSRESAHEVNGQSSVWSSSSHSDRMVSHHSLCVTFSFVIQVHVFNFSMLFNDHSQADVAQCCKKLVP